MKYRYSVCAILIIAWSGTIYARCDVQEVIEMAKQGMSTTMIGNACKDEVDVPECSVSKVLRLARKGQTESQIYETCDPEPQAISEANTLNGQGNSVQNSGLPSGTVLRQCGCWGYVEIGTRDQEPACKSGMAEAVACYAYCPAGGYQWGVRCL